MRILIAEDDFAGRNYMLRFLSKYGECDITVDGMEALEAFAMALEEEERYDLICLDITMPILDGYQTLKQIRQMEKDLCIPDDKKAIIIMTSTLGERKNVRKAFELGCTAYAGKPINRIKFEKVLKKLELI
ncbi:MAG: response regulator [Anaerolineaceae bacterium]|nr:MAG: response regulator [Anaerolineaceae bacterium]